MQDQRGLLIETLQNDEQLLVMLGDNHPFWNSDLEAENMHSIIPIDKLHTGMQLPIITIQIANENRVGTKLHDAFVYIRCYNEKDKTYYDIDKVLSRVKVILHNHTFTQYADNAVNIDTVYESTGAELQDEAYGLNFRESRYRLLYL